MSTFIAGALRRDVSFDSFTGFTDARVTSLENGVTFEGAIDPATCESIWWWFTSRDDEEQARRQTLHQLREAAATGDLEDIRAALLAAIDGQLGLTNP